jgi:hypothetical protein
MMLKRIVPMLLAGFAVYQWELRRRERDLQRGSKELGKRKPPEESTWEGEGGALKTTGAQLGPEPSHPPSGAPS